MSVISNPIAQKTMMAIRLGFFSTASICSQADRASCVTGNWVMSAASCCVSTRGETKNFRRGVCAAHHCKDCIGLAVERASAAIMVWDRRRRDRLTAPSRCLCTPPAGSISSAAGFGGDGNSAGRGLRIESLNQKSSSWPSRRRPAPAAVPCTAGCRPGSDAHVKVLGVAVPWPHLREPCAIRPGLAAHRLLDCRIDEDAGDGRILRRLADQVGAGMGPNFRIDIELVLGDDVIRKRELAFLAGLHVIRHRREPDIGIEAGLVAGVAADGGAAARLPMSPIRSPFQPTFLAFLANRSRNATRSG